MVVAVMVLLPCPSPLAARWDCAAEKNQMRSLHCLSSPLLLTIWLSQSVGMHTQGRVSASRTCVLWRSAAENQATVPCKTWEQPPSPSSHVMAYMGLWPHVLMFMGCSGRRVIWAFGIMGFQLITYTNTTSSMYNLGPPSSVGPRRVAPPAGPGHNHCAHPNSEPYAYLMPAT